MLERSIVEVLSGELHEIRRRGEGVAVGLTSAGQLTCCGWFAAGQGTMMESSRRWGLEKMDVSRHGFCRRHGDGGDDRNHNEHGNVDCPLLPAISSRSEPQ